MQEKEETNTTPSVWDIAFSDLEFVSDFELRISSFGFAVAGP